MVSTFNPFEANYDTINDKDDFNISTVSKNYTIDPLETEAERNIRTRTVYVDSFFKFVSRLNLILVRRLSPVHQSLLLSSKMVSF